MHSLFKSTMFTGKNVHWNIMLHGLCVLFNSSLILALSYYTVISCFEVVTPPITMLIFKIIMKLN